VASPLPQSSPPLVPNPEHGAVPFGTCGNCGAELSGPFCSQCGEKKLSQHDYSLTHFVEEIVDGFTHFDTKFLRTFKLLLMKPGELSNAFFLGGRSRYTRPLSLFIIINVIFFVVQPRTGLFGYKYANYMTNESHSAAVHKHLRSTGESEETYAARFNANLQNQKKSLLIVAVPVLALLMLVLFIGTGRKYVEHLVFAVQVYAFLLAYLAVVALFVLLPLILGVSALWPAASAAMHKLETEGFIDSVLLAGLTVYMYLGFRRAYRVSRLRAATSALVSALSTGLLIGAYHNLLFYAAFWTT
jgi:hypothetical protein